LRATIFLPLLIGLPLTAQTDFFQQGLLNRIKTSTQPSLLIFLQQGSNSLTHYTKLIQNEAVAELGLNLVAVPHTATINRTSVDSGNNMRRHFGLGSNILWAVVTPAEQLLLTGTAWPEPEEFVQQLSGKGVQSPASVLRDFLKTHPDHLDARVELLHLQLKSADKRTRTELDIDPDPDTATALTGNPIARNRLPGGGQSSTFTTSIRSSADGSSPTTLSFPGSVDPNAPKPKPIPDDKVLDTVTDLKIWGGYAESFDRLFVADDWIAVGLVFENREYPIEVCSPLVKNLYRRKISQVETALELAPVSPRLWSIWSRMADVVGDRSAISVFERLVPRPGANFSSWPEDVRNRLISEARTTGKWDFLANNLWTEYERSSGTNNSITSFAVNDANRAAVNDAARRVTELMNSDQWEKIIAPLLEALIRTNDTGRADIVVNTLKDRGEINIQKAIGLANICSRPDLAQRWGVFISEKESNI